MRTDSYGHCFLGVEYAAPPHELPMGALADGKNVIVNDSGLIAGRKGSVKVNTTSLASKITSFHEFKSGATVKKLCSYSTKIASLNDATGVWGDKVTGLTSGKMMQWVNFAGKAISVNEGSDAPQYYEDESTHGALAGSPPNGLTIAEWSNRLWFGGDSTNVATLTGSDLNDPTAYSAGGGATQKVSQTIGDSKDPITGIFPFFDWLIIGKINNLYKAIGNPATDATTLEFSPIYSKSDDNIGFTSQWGITQVGNDIIFLDGYDIKSLSGIQEFGDVEYTSIIPHCREYLKSIADKDYLKYTQFFHYKKEKQIWVSLPTSATTYFVFILDYKFKGQSGRYAFYPLGDLVVSCFGGVANGQVKDIYYGDGTGFVHQLDTGNDDNGSAIERYFVKMVSGNVIGGDRENLITEHEKRKQFFDTEAFIYSEQSALSMSSSYALDLMNDAQIRTSGNYTAHTTETVTDWSGTGIKSKRLKFYGLSGKTLSLKWSHNTVGQNFIFYPSQIHFKNKSRNLIT